MPIFDTSCIIIRFQLQVALQKQQEMGNFLNEQLSLRCLSPFYMFAL